MVPAGQVGVAVGVGVGVEVEGVHAMVPTIPRLCPGPAAIAVKPIPPGA